MPANDIRETRVYQEAFEEGFELGFKEGFELGFIIGLQEAAEKITLGMLEINRPIDEIVKVTGLTLAQIRKLKKKHKG